VDSFDLVDLHFIVLLNSTKPLYNKR